jgi:hypothetical protein
VTRVLVDVAGWAGALALLSAYALVSASRVTGHGWTFQLLNLAGAVGLALNGAYHGAWPSAALNSIWLAVGAIALIRLHTRQTEPRQGKQRVSTSSR